MSREKAQLMSTKLGQFKKAGKEYLYLCINKNCIPHSDELNKLSINFEKGYYKCWRCGIAGNIHKLIKRFSHDSSFVESWSSLDGTYSQKNLDSLFEDDKNDQNLENVEIELPENFESLIGNNCKHTIEAKNYLYSRGFTKKDIEFYKPGICRKGEFSGKVIFPSVNDKGRLNYFIARSYSGGIPYRKSDVSHRNIIFNELYIDWNKPIVLTEGVFDAVKVGYNAVPILGKLLNKNFKLFREIVINDPVVYLALDPDADNDALRIANDLTKFGVIVYKVNCKPFKDLGKMSKDEARDRIKSATLVNGNFLMTSLKTILGDSIND